MRKLSVSLILFVLMGSADAIGQSSSIGAKRRAATASQAPDKNGRETPAPRTNTAYENHAWIAFGPQPPKLYKVNDLVTIVVRQQRSFEIQADLKTQKKWDLKSELEEFFKLTNGGIGASNFTRGKPNIDFSWDNKLDSKGDTSREDRLTTRITARVIDVKPNGLLVLEGRGRIKHDEEFSTITITGSCRKDDVTADNTVLSTQIADLDVAIDNQGALRAAATRGWIPRLIDWLKPF